MFCKVNVLFFNVQFVEDLSPIKKFINMPESLKYMNVANVAKQQSPHWEAYQDSQGFISKGFPFNEGFPKGGPFGNASKVYELVLRGGERVPARVDYSEQYMADGIQWETTGQEAGGRRTLDKHVVAAWKEL